MRSQHYGQSDSRVGVSLSTDGMQANVWTICASKNGAEYHRTIKYGRLWQRAVKLALADRIERMECAAALQKNEAHGRDAAHSFRASEKGSVIPSHSNKTL
jgi:hypothetical protein